MRVFYHLDCIRRPMTGIGYHTLNMVASILKNYPDLEVLGCYKFQLLSKEEIVLLLEKVTIPQEGVSSLSERIKLQEKIIQLINQFSSARSFIQWRDNLSYRIKLKNKMRGVIYHEPNFVLLPHDGPKVITLHDISMFTCPEFLPAGRASFLRHQLSKGYKIADALIVNSQFIKDETVRVLNVSEHKIHVVPPGAQCHFMPRSQEETKPFLEKFLLHYKKFILCVATLEPRKNLVRLIQAYQALPQSLQSHYPLVLVGNKGWLYEEIIRLIEKSASSNIRLLRYVEEQTLWHLYSAAKLFVYPSLYEGFGLPVLEALQSGVPVITSKSSSLPEVCGDAGILIDPYDVVAIKTAIESLLTMDAATYDAYVQHSLRRSQEFSWDDFAKKLFKVYQKILKPRKCSTPPGFN